MENMLAGYFLGIVSTFMVLGVVMGVRVVYPVALSRPEDRR